jgi:thioredoxin reductase (NADPH)
MRSSVTPRRVLFGSDRHRHCDSIDTPSKPRRPLVRWHVTDDDLVQTYDCVVVGGGPAGLSAAIYLARYNRSVVVLDHGSGRSTTHEVNENYLGFPDGVASKELRERGREQAERFGARFGECKVERIDSNEGGFIAHGEDGAFACRTMILATGVKDILPECEGQDIHEFFGKSLFWCITCDGHKVRDARVAVVGATDEAATTAMQFLNFTDRLLLITNRDTGPAEITEKKRSHLASAAIPVIEGRIARFQGRDGMMTAVDLHDGRSVELDFMFNLQGARPNSLLARSLGVTVDEAGYIKTDNEQRTNVPMLFAAGDVTKAFAHQVVTAAHEGATAGVTANYELYRPEQREE